MNFEYLERHWQSDPQQDHLLERLLHSYRRCELEPPFKRLRSSPRWRRLIQLIDKFYKKPLTEEDGEPLEAIEQKEAELGYPLPEALKEWYRLVGRRYESSIPGCPRLADLKFQTPPLATEEREALGLPPDFKVIKISKGLHSRPSVWLCPDEIEQADPTLKVILPSRFKKPRQFAEVSALTDLFIGHCYKETFDSAKSGTGPLGPLRDLIQWDKQRAQSQGYLHHYAPCYTERSNELFRDCRYYTDGQTILKNFNGAVSVIHCDRDAEFKLTRQLDFDEFKECFLQFQWRDPSKLRQAYYHFISYVLTGPWGQLNANSQQLDNPSLNYDDEYPEGCFQRIATTCPIDDYDFVKCHWLLKRPHLLDGLQVGWKPYLSDRWTPLWPRDLEEFVPIEE